MLRLERLNSTCSFDRLVASERSSVYLNLSSSNLGCFERQLRTWWAKMAFNNYPLYVYPIDFRRENICTCHESCTDKSLFLSLFSLIEPNPSTPSSSSFSTLVKLHLFPPDRLLKPIYNYPSLSIEVRLAWLGLKEVKLI